MTRLIDAQDAFNVLSDYYHHKSSTQHLALEEALNKVQTVDAVPFSAVRKAAKKLAYIHQQIDLYGDRPDLHDEEYWIEYLMDEEWKDEEID